MKTLALYITIMALATYLSLAFIDKAMEDTKAAVNNHTTNLEE